MSELTKIIITLAGALVVIYSSSMVWDGYSISMFVVGLVMFILGLSVPIKSFANITRLHLKSIGFTPHKNGILKFKSLCGNTVYMIEAERENEFDLFIDDAGDENFKHIKAVKTKNELHKLLKKLRNG